MPKKSGSSAAGAKSSAETKKKTNDTASSSGTKRTKRVRKIGKGSYITTAIFLFLGIFLGIGYFNTDGAFIRLLCNAVKGLFGFGFYLFPPMLIISACIIAFSKKRSAVVRTVFILLIPLFAGTVFQLIKGVTIISSKGMFDYLWTSGTELAGGGIISGSFAALLIYLLSNIGAWIVTIIFLVVDFIFALGIPLSNIFSPKRKTKKQQREKEEFYEDVKEELIYGDKEKELERQREREKAREREAAEREEKEKAKAEKERARAERDNSEAEKTNTEVAPAPGKEAAPDPDAAIRSRIDIPVDPPRREKKTVNTPGFYNKHPSVQTPAEYLTGDTEKISDEEIDKVLNNEPVPGFPFDDDASLESPGPAPIDSNADKKPQPQQASPSTSGTADTNRGKNADEISAEEEIEEEISKTAAANLKSEYVFPPISLLTAPSGGPNGDSQEEIRANTIRLENTLKSFGINAEISNVIRGPSVTRYEMELEIGVKLNKLTNLADDIALALGATGVRISAIPNRISTVGIEVPNKNVNTVYLREIIDSKEFRESESKLTFAIGKDISGDAIVGNIARLPHLLVAGTTGSGKSVCLNSLILSILYKAKPDEVKFIMIDPKMVEFKVYNGIPHLLVPVVTEAKKASGALQWAVTEMMKRYRLFSESGARDLASYNSIVEKEGEGEKLPQIVVVIDELADLMLVAAKEVEESICRIAQMGRAAGVHLVIATQSPRADVITGLMKANIPSRIAFKVASALESRIILDSGGSADKLVGNGDMLFAPIGVSRPYRIQGTWVTDDERESIVEFVKKSGTAEYSEEIISEINRASEDKKAQPAPQENKQDDSDTDVMFSQAVDVVLEMGQASVSMLQRRLKLGYSRAARLVDQMEEKGIVGPFEGSKPRQVLITKEQWQEMQFITGTAPIAPQGYDAEQTMESADDLFDE